MQVSLKDAKARLSALVELAGGGEEVVITVRGRPRARLAPIVRKPIPNARTWARRLREARARYSTDVRDSSREILDETRDDRL